MTNLVFFPGLGLELALNRVAVTLLGRPIYWYGIIIAIGFLLAVLFCCRQGERFGVSPDEIMDLMLFAAPLSILGARIYYVLFYLDLYRREDGSLDFGAMLRISDGGLAIYGAVIMAALVLAVFCRVRKVPFLAFADLGVNGLLIGQCIGRWGNFMNVEAYGGVTELPWRMCAEQIAVELYGKGIVDTEGYRAILDGTLGVHPTFLYESLWNLLGLCILVFLWKRGRRFEGQNFCFYLMWYGVGRFIIEGLRTDSLYLFQTGLRVSQVVALVSVAIGLALLILGLKKRTGIPLWVEEKRRIRSEKEEKDHADHS